MSYGTDHPDLSAHGMTAGIELVLFDVGGVLGTNGWDREQRDMAVARFQLDPDDFQYRHGEIIGDLEEGRITLADYLDITVFFVPRSFSRAAFRDYMFALSEPWPASIGVARALAARPGLRLATLNNESAELNRHRLRHFGLRGIFPTFFTSCWLGVRKPMRAIYERVLGMTDADPSRTLFVDDRLQNLGTAAALGMRTVRFEDAEQLRVAIETEMSTANRRPSTP
jgi:putative hydrolase of the HAD superfamily